MPPEFQEPLVALGYTPAEGIDWVSPDGREAYELRTGGRGLRDLRDSAVRLATYLAEHPAVERGFVLTSLLRVSSQRVRSEWNQIRALLLPSLAKRMRLVALVDSTTVLEPPDLAISPMMARFLEQGKESSSQRQIGVVPGANEDWTHGSPLGTSWKQLEIEKVLLHHWLLAQGPIGVGALSAEVGCSYPTAIQRIAQLSSTKLIERGHGRSVKLGGYPRDRWAELFRAQRLVYPPAEFIDPTGQPGAVEELLRRLARLRPKGLAIGGVMAARKWDPEFDLNGTPRIDLVLHTPAKLAPSGAGRTRDPKELARRIDPALRRRTPDLAGGSAVLVIHRTFRQESLFLEEGGALPWASPVEVLTQLNDLGLTAQANQLVRRLREDKHRED